MRKVKDDVDAIERVARINHALATLLYTHRPKRAIVIRDIPTYKERKRKKTRAAKEKKNKQNERRTAKKGNK